MSSRTAGSRATTAQRPGSPADVVRFEDGKLAEHWDVLQDEATKADSVSGLPTFGDHLSRATTSTPVTLKALGVNVAAAQPDVSISWSRRTAIGSGGHGRVTL